MAYRLYCIHTISCAAGSLQPNINLKLMQHAHSLHTVQYYQNVLSLFVCVCTTGYTLSSFLLILRYARTLTILLLEKRHFKLEWASEHFHLDIRLTWLLFLWENVCKRKRASVSVAKCRVALESVSAFAAKTLYWKHLCLCVRGKF